MTTTAVVGVNWGDEGKGRMVDFLARDADVVVRFQGGNNAGHTVVNEAGVFQLHLIPSGVFNPDALCVLGPGMVIDLEDLVREIDELASRGVDCSNIRVSDRATICFPFHRLEDAWEEARLGRVAYGSTLKGIAPAYGDRALKKAIQVGELLRSARLEERLRELVAYKSLVATGVYGKRPHAFGEILVWTHRFGERIAPLIVDVQEELQRAVAGGARVLAEAQLGALRDVSYGTYPFTSSSSCLADYAAIGGGLLGGTIDRTVGVMKAFSTCVGAGPFVTRMDPAAADSLRKSAGEYGATTGRAREIGHFDAVASRYGAALQGASEIALTKLDVLTGLESLRICTAYSVGDERLERFPLNHRLEVAKPVYEEMAGWSQDISGVRTFRSLPEAARDYVLRLEQLVERPIRYVSTGPQRESLIDRGVPAKGRRG